MEFKSILHLLSASIITNHINSPTMETKKSERADLEPKKSIFLELGFIVALALTLAAFEWQTPVKRIAISTSWEPVVEDVVIKNTIIEDRKPAPVPVVAPLINVVGNDDPVTENPGFDPEINPTDEVPFYLTPVSNNLEEEKSVTDETPFIVPENMPEFPGGIGALQTFLAKNIEYPEAAAETGIQGTVYLYFVVEKDGSISNIKTLRGIGGGCNDEAERVIRKMPRWKPGSQCGKPVRVSFSIPVVFSLK